MAEILGLVAAIGSVADIAFNRQKGIRRLARQLGAAQGDIRKFATEIEDFSLVIGFANLQLHEFAKKSSAETKVLQSICNHKLFNRILAASNLVIDHIDEIWPRLKSLESSVPLWERIKWVSRRSQVDALGPKMESVKSSLQLVVSVVTLESVLNQNQSREVKRQVKRLNRQIVHQKERIAELTEELRHAREQELEIHDKDEFVDLQRGLQEVVDLGESMVEQGRVLDLDHSSVPSFHTGTHPPLVSGLSAKPPSSSSSEPRPLRRARSPIRQQPVERIVSRAPPYRPPPMFIPNPEEQRRTPSTGSEASGTIEITELPSERPTKIAEWPGTSVVEHDAESPISVAESPTTAATSPISSLATTVESKELRPQPLELTHKRRRISRRHEKEESSSSSVTEVLGHRPPDQSGPVEIERKHCIEQAEASVISRVEEDFIPVGSKIYPLELNSSRTLKSIPGYINTDTGSKLISALFDISLDYNLVSLACLQRLGLKPELPDEQRPWFTFGSGRKTKCCGEALISWSEGLQYRKPLRVRCLVFEHDFRGSGLMLGNPFWKLRTYSWGDHEELEIEERLASYEEREEKGQY